jgi:hypothetical protein
MGNYIHNQMEWNVCVLCFPFNLLLSQNNTISLRGLRKSARRRACALMGVHGAALDIKIYIIY